MYDHILLATDGRTNTHSAIEYACRLSDRDEAVVDILFVERDPGILSRVGISAAKLAGATVTQLDADPVFESVEDNLADTDRLRITEHQRGRMAEIVPGFVNAHGSDHVVINRVPLQRFRARLTTGHRGRLARRLDVPLTFVGHPAKAEEDGMATEHGYPGGAVNTK